MKKQVIERDDTKDTTFSEHTFVKNLEKIQKRFLHMLPERATIMDLGCGSGRDSLYFKEQGLTVIPVEESRVLCNIAAKHTGLQVRHMRPDELNEVNRFDGIWVEAALVHLSYEEIVDVLQKVSRALKPNGVLYVAFRYGTLEGKRDGRQFTDLDEKKLQSLLKEIRGVKEEWITFTPDVRPESNQQWMNIFLRKLK